MTSQTVADRLKRLLWEEWDPIGVNTSSCPVTEYDAYVDKVMALLSKGASVRDISDILSRAEVVDMRLPASGRALTVARRAWELASSGTQP